IGCVIAVTALGASRDDDQPGLQGADLLAVADIAAAAVEALADSAPQELWQIVGQSQAAFVEAIAELRAKESPAYVVDDERPAPSDVALDPIYFRDFGDLAVGDRVRYTIGVHGSGTGTVALIWLGIEEMCDVVGDDNVRRSLCRAIGDTVEAL